MKKGLLFVVCIATGIWFLDVSANCINNAMSGAKHHLKKQTIKGEETYHYICGVTKEQVNDHTVYDENLMCRTCGCSYKDHDSLSR